MTRSNYTFTSESVSEGHPDKVCDRISDAVLDAFLAEEPEARVAAETFATTNRVVIGGEVGLSDPDKLKDYMGRIDEIARACIKDIGYEQDKFHHETVEVTNLLHEQSAHIAQGVDAADNKDEGAGDQGIMFGYATNETEELMPAPIQYSHAILRRLAEVRKDGTEPTLGPDAKSQLSVRYENGKPVGVTSIVLSTQHLDEAMTSDDVRLVVEPYISAVLQAGMIIAKGGTSEQKQAWLEPLIAGTSLPAVAYIEPQARFNVNDVRTTATANADGYSVNGFKGVVLGGPFADLLIVPARTSGSQTDAEGITLFMIDANADGVSRRDYPTIDGFRASEITLSNVSVSKDAVLGSADQGLALLQYGLDQGMMGAAAEAVGAMEVLYKSTVEYCKTREQFGQPIGKFQVLQHRMVDMFIEHEQTKSLAFMAAMKLAEGYNDASRKALSALKVQVGKGGTLVGQQAVQLHGGMGMTNELNIGHYFKRLTAIETLYGNTDFHLKRYASL